jgi:hypothetical protein
MSPSPPHKTLIKREPEKVQKEKPKNNNDKKKLWVCVTVIYSITTIFTFTRWYLMLLITAFWALIIISLSPHKKNEVKRKKQ